MKPKTAFSQFQTVVNADPEQLAIARSRRDAFVTALGSESDIDEVVVGGSLRRGTQRAPISDVDIYAVYCPGSHATWGETGPSADDAIELASDRIAALLGEGGSHVHLLNEDDGSGTCVRLKGRRRHSVKCFVDDPGDGLGFTVDVVPALRHSDGGLLIPERDLEDAENGKWIRTDPESLVAMVKDQQESWSLWVPTVRMLKCWSARVETGMSSLYVEALALKSLPTDSTRAEAIQRFFTSAEWCVSSQLEDPTGLCGPIQPDLDVDAAKERIVEAEALSTEARLSEANGKDDDAVCAWRQVFGSEFPEPARGCDGSSAKVAAAGAPVVIKHSRRPIKDSPQG